MYTIKYYPNDIGYSTFETFDATLFIRELKRLTDKHIKLEIISIP